MEPLGENMQPKLCAIVPSYNHYTAVGAICAGLRVHGLSVFIVDDASDEPARTSIAALHAPAAGVEVIRLTENQGKAGAVAAGLRIALVFGQADNLDAGRRRMQRRDRRARRLVACIVDYEYTQSMSAQTGTYCPRGRVVVVTGDDSAKLRLHVFTKWFHRSETFDWLGQVTREFKRAKLYL